MAYKFLQSSILGSPFEGDNYKVIGGGVAGLFMGYYLKRQHIEFRIIENSERAGGLIETQTTEYGNAEAAANGFIWCPELEDIAETVGIKILPPSPASKKKYIFYKGKLKTIPLSFGELATALWNVAIPKKVQPVTVQEFSNIYLNKAVSAKILNPAMGGIYAADISDLSFPGALPELARLQQKGPSFLYNFLFKKERSKSKKIAGTHSFLHGMGQLTEGLAAYLKEEVKLYADGKKFIGSHKDLILSVPAYVAADFFEGHELQKLLKEVKYVPVISAKVFFKKDTVDHIRKGFGCVIPKSEDLKTIGVLFNHDIFPEHVEDDFLSFTCIMRDNYKEGESELFALSENELKDLLLKELSKIFHIKKGPAKVVINRYENGIPLYSPQHYENLFKIDELLKKDFSNIRLFGNYTGQISIRGMAQEAARWTALKG